MASLHYFTTFRLVLLVTPAAPPLQFPGDNGDDDEDADESNRNETYHSREMDGEGDNDDGAMVMTCSSHFRTGHCRSAFGWPRPTRPPPTLRDF